MSSESSTSTKDPSEKKQPKCKQSSLWEYKITGKEFQAETAPEERELLRKFFNDALVSFFQAKKSVYLERFGILYPVVEEQTFTELVSDRYIMKKENYLTVFFEKCSELLSLHRERYTNIVETPEIAEYIFLRLPTGLQLRWQIESTRRYLRALISSIRDEVVVDGFSPQLRPIGELFALHNRQGESVNDWYAGANIILTPHYHVPLACEIQRSYRQPRLNNATELLEAAYGETVDQFDLDLGAELEALGYDRSAFQNEIPEDEQQLSVHLFQHATRTSTRSSETTFQLTAVTEGVRHMNRGKAPGTELITQVLVPNDSSQDKALYLLKKLLTLGWILLQSAPEKRLDSGLGVLSEPKVLAPEHTRTKLSAVITTQYSPSALPHKTKRGLFQYINILGVTEDELQFLELRSPEHLLTLLRCKGFDQVTDLSRRSIFGK